MRGTVARARQRVADDHRRIWMQTPSPRQRSRSRVNQTPRTRRPTPAAASRCRAGASTAGSARANAGVSPGANPSCEFKCRAIIGRRHRQAARVEEAPRERLRLASARTASRKTRAPAPLGEMKSRRAGGRENVLVRRPPALDIVAVDQPLGRVPAQHMVELPRQIVGVLDAGVAAARAERRDLMRRIPGKITCARAGTAPAGGTGSGSS